MNPDTARSRDSRVTLLFCVLTALCEGLDIQAAGVAAPGISRELHPSPAELGTFFTASSTGLLLGAAIGGRLADRFGRKAVLLLSITMFGLFSILTSVAGDLSSLVIARGLTGLGLGGAMPNLIAIAADVSGSKYRHTSIATTYVGMPLGGAIAGVIVMFVPADGWRILFRAGGIAPLLIVPAMLWFMPAVGRPAERSDQPDQAVGSPFAVLFQSGRGVTTALLWIAFLLIVLILHLMLNWLPLLLQGRGLPTAHAALAQMGLNAGGDAALVVGALLDTRWQRTAVIATVLTLPAMLVLVATAPPRIGVLFGLVVLLGGAMLAAQVIAYGVASATYPAPVRGTGVGAAIASGRNGSLIGPVLAAVLIGAGRSPAQVLVDLLPVVLASGVVVGLLGWKRLAQPPP